MGNTAYLECPVCGRQTGTTGPEGRRMGAAKCSACNALDRKPREPRRLGEVIEWAAVRAAGGCTVHIRPIRGRGSITLHPGQAINLRVTDPEQLVIAVALR